MKICITIEDGEQVEADLLIPDEKGGMKISPDYVVDVAPGEYLVKRFALGRELGKKNSILLFAVVEIEEFGFAAIELEPFHNVELKDIEADS